MTDVPRLDPATIVPPGVRQRLTPEDIAAAEIPHRLGESPDEAAARAAAAHASRIRMWEARLPTRFRDASLADLTPEQDPDGKVSGWLDSGSLTLLLHSIEPGVGKTHAAYAVGNTAVSAVGGALWTQSWSMVDLNDAFRPGNDPTAYTVAQECDLLVLDDLGRERISEWTLERLQGVIDARWRSEKRTVITTNMTGEAFVKRYGAPIVDRITDGLTRVLVTGVTRRAPAPW